MRRRNTEKILELQQQIDRLRHEDDDRADTPLERARTLLITAAVFLRDCPSRMRIGGDHPEAVRDRIRQFISDTEQCK